LVCAFFCLLCSAVPAQVTSYTARESLWERFCDGPLADLDEIVFAVREPGTDHWYANFGYYSSPRNEDPPQRAPGGKVKLREIYKGGGRLCLLNLRTKALRVLLDDPDSSVRDPHVHYDGKTVLFSYRRPGDAYFHLCEIDTTDGGMDSAPPHLRQLTDGPWNDIEPVYLPDGGIVFCSDRCKRFVNCWVAPVATLHRCDADGRNMVGVKRGEIKELLVLEQLPKPVNFSGGPWPISNGGTFTLARILGTVPVEPDGSAFMEVPAMRSPCSSWHWTRRDCRSSACTVS